MKVLHFQVKGMEAKHMAWLMASNPRRPFDLIWTALPNVGSEKCCWPCPIRPVLFWFMTKVADDLGSLRHHWLRARVILTKAWPATPWDAGILYSAV